MSENDTAHLSNWFHFRKEMKRPMPKVSELADVDPAIGKFILPFGVALQSIEILVKNKVFGQK